MLTKMPPGLVNNCWRNLIHWGKGSGSVLSLSNIMWWLVTSVDIHLAPDTISKCTQRLTVPVAQSCKKKKNGRGEVGLLRGGSWRPVASCSQGGWWPGGGQAAPRSQVKITRDNFFFELLHFLSFQFTTRWQPGLHPPAQGWVSYFPA